MINEYETNSRKRDAVNSILIFNMDVYQGRISKTEITDNIKEIRQ
jgi:hypothetical protein